jgi:hypothetical protein
MSIDGLDFPGDVRITYAEASGRNPVVAVRPVEQPLLVFMPDGMTWGLLAMDLASRTSNAMSCLSGTAPAGPASVYTKGYRRSQQNGPSLAGCPTLRGMAAAETNFC